jgi:hypothetical protein
MIQLKPSLVVIDIYLYIKITTIALPCSTGRRGAKRGTRRQSSQ